jgi:hypothetical protein
MIGELQGSRMQISRSLSPIVETGTGKGTDRESGTARKSETGKELRKEEQNGWQESSIAISSPGILFTFAPKFLVLKCFVLYGDL